MFVSLFLYGLVVLALLIAEVRENRTAQAIIKPIAALGFILLAIYFGALNSNYGKIIFTGLLACAAGDVFLLSRKSEKLFMGGMAAFAIGHLAYVWAFIQNISGDYSITVMASCIFTLFSTAIFFAWLKPKLSQDMRLPVFFYTLIILSMVLTSITINRQGAFILAPIGAIMFAISDMFVARDRFVKPDAKNAFAITPLYFGAQVLFALSTQI